MSTKRIALWGYGYYGKDLEFILTRGWPGRYEITAVFDRNYARLGRTNIGNLPIQDPELAEELFRRGAYDELLISVYDPDQNALIRSELEARGIPVCRFDTKSPMQLANYFPLWEPSRTLPEGYQYYCFRDLLLETVGYERYPFVYDREGTLNGAYWHSYQRSSDTYCRYYAPGPRTPDLELEGEWCILSGIYGKNYWHFTYESLDRFRVLENAGYTGRYLIYHTPFAEELLRLAGADPDRIFWIEDLQKGKVYHVERLVCLTVPNYYLDYAAPVLKQVSDTVKRNLPPVTKKYPERLFVRRIGTRKLRINEETLSRYGFQTIVPEELSVTEQIRHFEQAKIVLCPHGANSTNSLYMRPGSVFLETFSCSYVNPLCTEALHQLGVYYLSLTQPWRDWEHPKYDPRADYSIPAPLLELAMRAAEKLIR